MDRDKLITAIQKSGGAGLAENEIEGLLAKLSLLEASGRYNKLLTRITASNDKSNFLAAVFEATFAYQFETAGLPLEYEVKQSAKNETDIDFLRRMGSGKSIYFEARLLQQEQDIEKSIKDQLQETKFYQVVMTGDDEHDAIVRLQSAVLGKVQRKDGTPVKFFKVENDTVNIVVVEVSDQILGAIDYYDCLLAANGDPSVSALYRRQIFGLFQAPSSTYPENIKKIAESYEHVRNTLSGILFAFKSKNSGVLDYRLEQHLIFNPGLVNKPAAEAIFNEIGGAIPARSP